VPDGVVQYINKYRLYADPHADPRDDASADPLRAPSLVHHHTSRVAQPVQATGALAPQGDS
jgi:nicotinate-nucleotide adenylyltransferase